MNLKTKDKDEKTPLHMASIYGKTNVIKFFLISKGANKNTNGKTPYDFACDSILADISQRGIIRQLLR